MIRTDGRPTIAMRESDALLSAPAAPDFSITDHGSILLFHIHSGLVEQWVEENVGGEVQYWGDAIVVEPRYIAPIIEALEAEGFTGGQS